MSLPFISIVGDRPTFDAGSFLSFKSMSTLAAPAAFRSSLRVSLTALSVEMHLLQEVLS